MPVHPNDDFRLQLRRVIGTLRETNVQTLIDSLRDYAKPGDPLESFADHLLSARSSADLLRELFRTWILEPTDNADPTVVALRSFFGWSDRATDFDELRPEFLDVIYLLPPRDYAIAETLLPFLDYMRLEIPTPPAGAQSRTLLDVGTGTGLLLQILRTLGMIGAISGLDPAPKMAEYAHRRLREPEAAEIAINKIQNFRKDSPSFQSVLCYMVMHHISDENHNEEYRRALRSIFDALEEGGLFVYTDKLWAEREGTELHAFDFKTPMIPWDLKSGQELDIEPAELNAIAPFRPHPHTVPEYTRTWDEAAEMLSQEGFLIQRAKPLNERVFLFVCRKPHIATWSKFAQKPSPQFVEALTLVTQTKADVPQKHAPYNWTFSCLAALYEDITEQRCPDRNLSADETVSESHFLRGVAYFSWEKASRLFLVRRARPFDFHILSYSYVHAGWGSLGRMVEDFERHPIEYTKEKGYSSLNRDSVQRTLPFQGDIKSLQYEAAMAVPVYHPDTYELRGAFLFYLAKREYVPLHTGSELQRGLVTQFQHLNKLMNLALDWQEKRLGVRDSAREIVNNWEKLAEDNDGANVVIAKLNVLFATADLQPGDYHSLSALCSRIQALLSSSECFSVLDEREMAQGKASILVAARVDLSFEDIRDKILAAVGAAAEKCGPFSYTCRRLGEPDAGTADQ